MEVFASPENIKYGKIFFTLLATIAVWAMSRAHFSVAIFDVKTFYNPIFSKKINMLQHESSIKVKLKQNYDAQHGLFLSFPCKKAEIQSFAKFDGLLQYKFISGGKTLKRGYISSTGIPCFTRG